MSEPAKLIVAAIVAFFVFGWFISTVSGWVVNVVAKFLGADEDKEE